MDSIIAEELKNYIGTTLLVLDLTGTFVFALSGGIVAVRKKLDLFGVLVLAFAAGNAGGITRDVIIGSVPPAAIIDWRYICISIFAGLVAFIWYSPIHKLKDRVQLMDAAGLALFAVAGAEKAIVFGLNPLAAALLGMLTGIGGGMLRDVLVAQIPGVLTSELYAVAALAGASVVVLGHVFKLELTMMAIAGAALCFAIRFLAIRRGWHLPVAKDRTTKNPPSEGE
jgi:uncharacterized membrane protein YeiH